MTIREELVLYGQKIADKGLVAGAGGNISAREDDIVWMKPSGMAMDDMTVDDLCGIELASGNQLSGEHRPTSEVGMHLGIYRVRPDVAAVFHTHSPWASGVISAGVELRPMFAEFINDLGRVGTVPYLPPTTQILADAIAAKAACCDTIMMVNHGVLATGVRMKQAYFRALVVEDAAKSMVAASVVGRPSYLSEDQVAELMELDGPKHRITMMEG